jgi:hypothetical protein
MLPPALAVALRDRGFDVETVAERRDLVGAPDETVLEVATSERRIVVTRNIVDFVPLSQQWAAAGRQHAGVVAVATKTFPQDRSFLGAATAALNSMLQGGQLPGPGQVAWLSR